MQPKEKKLLINLEKGDVLRKLNSEDEYYTIHEIHREKLGKDRESLNFELKGYGTGCLVRDRVMKKMFETEFFSSDGEFGKKFVIYQR